jgi:hypothetical protein
MKRRIAATGLLGLLFVTLSAKPQKIVGFKPQDGFVPDAKLKLCPTEDVMAIRFFYNNESNYFHGPLLFRSVPAGDPRLNTAPMLDEGRTAYISPEEMSDLMSRLASTDFLWRNSEKSEALGKGTRIPYRGDFMQLLVVCRKSTSKGRIEPKQICQKLAPLDTALVSPRARWEFQLFRIGDGCTVQNFDEAAFPDHNYGI